MLRADSEVSQNMKVVASSVQNIPTKFQIKRTSVARVTAKTLTPVLNTGLCYVLNFAADHAVSVLITCELGIYSFIKNVDLGLSFEMV